MTRSGGGKKDGVQSAGTKEVGGEEVAVVREEVETDKIKEVGTENT